MLISQIVDAIAEAQEQGFKVLTFVIPVTPDAIERSGLDAATIEDRVQTAMIAELNTALGLDPATGQPLEPTCGVTIPGVGPCTATGEHTIHERGPIRWNGAPRGEL